MRHGLELVLSRFGAGAQAEFEFTEPEDVVGVGFHLMGGAQFDLGEKRIATQALDVWAMSLPRGYRSLFSLPSEGFQTVSIRMTPDAARGLLDEGRYGSHKLHALLGQAGSRAQIEQGDPIGALGAARVTAMLGSAYTGPARRLYLESCVLGLLADQLDTPLDAAKSTPVVPLADHRRMLAARDCLESRLENPPTTLELAREIGVNDFKLKRDFKRSFGETIFGYVRRRRLEQASTHLGNGLSVQEAAYAAGYQCPRCFADAFRRQFGVLPRDVSKAMHRRNKSPAGYT